MSPGRAAALVRKEFLHIVRDPRNLFLVTLSPAFLLFLLAYVFSFDVGQFRLVVLDLDHSILSRRYLAHLTGDGDWLLSGHVASYEEAFPLLVRDQVDVVLVIPPGFANAIYGGRLAQVQVLLDGSDPFAGSQGIASLEARSQAFATEVAAPGAAQIRAPVEIRTQVRYNPALDSLVSMVPGLLAIVLLMPTLALTLALVREKETGTLEALIATPVTGMEYLAGKLLAYVSAGLVSAILALLVAVLWFRVPFRGSLGVYLLLAADYLLACMGAAVVTANFAKSQQTAMFIILLVFLVPSFFLAGLISPVGSESLVSMLTSYVLPSTHFVEISRVVFLKGLGLAHLSRAALLLLGMGLGAILIGLALFRKKVA
jgi:ABC-2 type transport system permease protein